MDLSGSIILLRLTAQQRATDVLATNLANADTPGFRASQSLFATHMIAQHAKVGAAAMTVDRATWQDFTPGPLQATGNPLDLALSSDGFFAIETPNGERYTCAGHFTLSPLGQVVDAEGHAVLSDQGQPLTVPAGDSRIEVKGDGTIASESGPIGKLRVTRFAAPQHLLAEGDRLFEAPAATGAEPAPQPGVVQGKVEGSNVRPVAEVTRMTTALRQFQFAAQFLEKEDERQKSVIDRILRQQG